MHIDKATKYWYKYDRRVVQNAYLYQYAGRRKKMGGKTSTTVKNRYNAKAYDQIPLRVKKGEKDVIQKRAEQLGKSVNGYIVDLIEEDIEKSDFERKSNR